MFLHYLLVLLSLLLYIYGFFPIPITTTPIFTKTKSTNQSLHFEKIVLVVVDALRFDFVTAELLPKSTKLSSESGCLIKLKAETPTVTLPRIKALTTGNVAQFIDILVNLANPQVLKDSFVHRAHEANRKIVFYGDETWLKLFPELFLRYEGTSSFYVNDFYEVDTNVTRNVYQELDKNDWDFMILHYLGLDHIGHVFGPKSALIPPKLAEMDEIIASIHSKTPNKTLILITSDHGMRDSGGHGGSTSHEVNIPLLIIGTPCTTAYFPQIDVAANLAVLGGFQTPSTSIGKLQVSVLETLNRDVYLQALKDNTELLKNKLDICGNDYNTANYYYNSYFENRNLQYRQLAVELFEGCSAKISEKLQNASVKQNLKSLIIATVVNSVVFIHLFRRIFQGDTRVSFREQIVLVFVTILQFYEFPWNLNVVLVFISIFVLIRNYFVFKKTIPTSKLMWIVVFQPLTFFSSSFVEEEHQFWYFFINTILLYELMCQNWKFEPFFLMIAIRLLRGMNQVGDKYASSPDFSDFLLKSENYRYFQIVFVSGLVLTFFSTYFFIENRLKLSQMSYNFVIFVSFYIFRTIAHENPTLGKLIWALILSLLIYCILTRQSLISIWILIISLLLKPYNIIMIPFCVFASYYIKKTVAEIKQQAITHWILANVVYFLQGHDNNLACVDISAGYIGLETYQPIFVFFQVISHTFALPALIHGLLLHNQRKQSRKCFEIFLFLRINVIITVFLVTFIQRHHLFIWSVFAPKIFVESGHFAFLFTEMCVYYSLNCIK